jgi:hypothetical protein
MLRHRVPFVYYWLNGIPTVVDFASIAAKDGVNEITSRISADRIVARYQWYGSAEHFRRPAGTPAR